jgi:hypothetical protein
VGDLPGTLVELSSPFCRMMMSMHYGPQVHLCSPVLHHLPPECAPPLQWSNHTHRHHPSTSITHPSHHPVHQKPTANNTSQRKTPHLLPTPTAETSTSADGDEQEPRPTVLHPIPCYLHIGLCAPRPSLPRHPALLLHTPAQTLAAAGVCLACTVTWQRATGLANRPQGFVHLCRGLWVMRTDYRCYLCARKAWDVDEEPTVGRHASAGGTGRAYKCG